MDFPHLSDTDFPIIDNVNVYAYQNRFDYTRWVAKTRIKLTNVLWNGDYNDVVKFASDSARDDWFDNLTDYYTVVLKGDHALPPEGVIKLPIPFDVASRYNYLVVDIPVMTGEDDEIEYESAESGIRRWHFFVNEVSSRAPNTTAFYLSLDVWTQFHNDVDIKYMFLERGHAPVAATDTDRYLANPIGNSDYLLTPDVTPHGADIVRSSRMIPFGNGAKILCIASTCAPNQLASLGYITHGSADYTYGTPTFYDMSGRNGHQLGIELGIGNGDDYSSLRTPCGYQNKDSRLPNNIFVYGVPSEWAYGDVLDVNGNTLFEDWRKNCPQFLNTIRGCFVVDEDMVTMGQTQWGISEHSVRQVFGTEQTEQIGTLTKAQFGYPQRYQRFAKLYTYPYASIELTDNEGNKATVRIESTGSMEAHMLTEIAFPYVKMRTFFTGIGGVGSDSYQWVDLKGTTHNESIPKSDWFDYCFDHEIPCYALYMDGETAWYVDNFNSALRRGRLDVIGRYKNAVRPANNARENALDYDDMVEVNAGNNADTMWDNVDADRTLLLENTANTVATNRANTDATMVTNLSKVQIANNKATSINAQNNLVTQNRYSNSNYVNTDTAIAQNLSTIAVANDSGQAAVLGAGGQVAAGLGVAAVGAGASAALGAAVGSAALPGIGTIVGAGVGVAIGGIAGLISAGASWSAANNNAQTIANANGTTVNAQNNANTNMGLYTQFANDQNTERLKEEKVELANEDNSLLDANTDRGNANLTSNNTNTGNTLRNNATRSRNTAKTNASNTQVTLDSNATNTRDTMIDNAKQDASTAVLAPQYAMLDARNAQARQVGQYTGDPTSDYFRNRGVQVKVRTMPDSEVRQVGDWFARFGYAVEQVWDVDSSGLCPMRNFCYWKVRDIWVDDRKSSNNAALALITSMFERGVTIWKNPDEVGRVNPYDNVPANESDDAIVLGGN